MLNGLKFSTFPGVRESLAHACWGLWNPLASQTVRNRASDQPLRKRRSPSRAPPLPLCAGAQSRAGNLRSGRAHPSPRRLLLSRASFLGPPRNPPFFSSTLPTRRAKCREPGPRPFSVSLFLTNLISVLPPFFRSRSRKEPKRRRKKPKLSAVSEAFPKRWRKEPKFTGRGGVSALSGKSRSLASGLILRLGPRARAGNLQKAQESESVRIVGNS